MYCYYCGVQIGIDGDRGEFFSISNFRHVMNVVFFLLGDSPSFGVYLPSFHNTLFSFDRRCKQEEGSDIVFRNIGK